MPANGGPEGILIDDGGASTFEQQPTASPDDSRVAFRVAVPGDPDGSKIAYVRSAQILTAGVDGTERPSAQQARRAAGERLRAAKRKLKASKRKLKAAKAAGSPGKITRVKRRVKRAKPAVRRAQKALRRANAAVAQAQEDVAAVCG